ncbi:MAG: glycosyltransferase family 39 protein [Actinomycetota bacterium]
MTLIGTIGPLTTSRIAPVRRTAAALGALGTLVSLLGSWTPSLWGDEAASVLSAERSVPSLLMMIQHVDAVHGTYYLGLHFWIGLFGTSPFSIRLPSAIAIGVCVAGMVVLGSRLDSLRVGVVAGIVCAVLPRVTSMGQEARSYAFSAAIATWLTVLLVDILAQPRPARRRWVAYGALLALAIYVFLYLVLIAAAHLLLILMRADRRSLVKSWGLAAGFAVVAASPLIVTGIFEHGQIAYLATRTEVTFATLAVGLWFGTNAFALLAWALIAAALVVLVLDWRSRRVRVRLAPPALPAPTIVAMVWLVVPSALLVGSHFLVPDFTARYLSMCAPAAAMLIGMGIVGLARRRLVVTVLLLAVVVGFSVPVWVQQRGPFAKNNSDWAQISSRLGAVAQPGDAVAFDESVRPSRLPRLALNTYPAGFAGLRDVTLKTPFSKNTTWHDDVYTLDEAAALGRLDGVTRLWMVEYAIGSTVDTDGIAELATLGFQRGTTIMNHRSAIIEFDR